MGVTMHSDCARDNKTAEIPFKSFHLIGGNIKWFQVRCLRAVPKYHEKKHGKAFKAIHNYSFNATRMFSMIVYNIAKEDNDPEIFF